MLNNVYTRYLIYLAIFTSLIMVPFVATTTMLSNNETNGGIFGSFDSTGAAIILIGFPWLMMQVLDRINAMPSVTLIDTSEEYNEDYNNENEDEYTQKENY
jgi:hypothetical protein